MLLLLYFSYPMKTIAALLLWAFFLSITVTVIRTADKVELMQAEQKVIRSYYEVHKWGRWVPKKSFTLDKE